MIQQLKKVNSTYSIPLYRREIRDKFEEQNVGRGEVTRMDEGSALRGDGVQDCKGFQRE